MIYFESLTREQLADLLLTFDSHLEDDPDRKVRRSRYRATQLFRWVYQRFITDWDQMSDLSKDLRGWLRTQVQFYSLGVNQSRQALDGTHKFLWRLQDGKTVESVIIPAALTQSEDDGPRESHENHENLGGQWSGSKVSFGANEDPLRSEKWGRLTACISSQVGCAMGCKFCLTGIQGLDRNLEAHEIVAQVFELRKRAPITNIVFMGMGEPLHNFDAVVTACKILLDPYGLHFSKRKVTVSTSGLVSAIDKLGQEVDVSLAISLNGTTDEQRSMVMPVNKKWNISELLNSCRRYPLGSHRRITFEYVMLQGINDSLEDAKRLVTLTRGIACKVNLIPFNEHPGSDYKRPTDERVREFQKILLDRNLTATVRISRGRDILAACGQLRSIFGTAKGSEKHRDLVVQAVN